MDDPCAYPKTRARAKAFGHALRQSLATVSPATEPATIVNTDAALTTGTVQATTRKGVVNVVGVPLNSVCPGMKVFIRKMTRQGQTYYVFDNHAPSALSFGTTSGAIANAHGYGPAAATSTLYGSGTVDPVSPLTTVGSGPTDGWFWSFFLYLSALPPAGRPCTLLDMPKVDGSHNITGGFRISYDHTGRLNAYFYNWPSTVIGAPAQHVFSPHRVWFVTMQLGNGLAVDGQQYGDMAIAQLTAGLTISAGNYAMFLLSDSNGQNAAPAGSWMSKITFGNNYVTSPLWPYNLGGFIPSSDTDIVTGSSGLGSGLQIYNRWLCGDASGSTLPDTGTASTPLSIIGTPLTIGPF